jgi:predicted DNA binding CopG/RHH family protein
MKVKMSTSSDKRSTLPNRESQIPNFQTIEEEAEFWDTHSITDFLDEMEEVTDAKFVRARLKKGVTIRLDEDKLADLRQEAKSRGISAAALARIWILERLQDRMTESKNG